MKLVGVLLACLLSASASAQPLPQGIPDLCANPTISAVVSGAWSNAATWSLHRVPQAGDKLVIPAGMAVTYDQQSDVVLACVGVKGVLTFSTTANTRLTQVTLVIYPGGTLTVGPEPLGKTAEIVIADQAPNTSIDPEQYGTGILVFGKVAMIGAQKLPWTRLTVEPTGSTLSVQDSPATWQPNDKVVLPDTRQLMNSEVTPAYVWQGEILTVASIAGNVATLTGSLVYPHRGARSAAGSLDYLPHVGNLTRNVIVRSANPAGTRGHLLATSRADVTLQYVAFNDMGRTTYAQPLDSYDPGPPVHIGTNQIGRYPVHMHHLAGPYPVTGQYQFTIKGVVVNGAPKWGIAIHDSHFGLIQDNVVYNSNGAAIVSEDGSETQNLFDHNFAVRGLGTGGREAGGREGTGFWFRGADNIVTNNVAANFMADQYDSAYGFKYFLEYLGSVRRPKFAGADTTQDAQVDTINGNAVPIRKFDHNEVYGATESGLTFWWIGTDFQTPIATADSLITNFVVWHVYNRAIYHYQAYRLTVDGLVVRGSAAELAGDGVCCQSGVDFGDYYGNTITYRNFDIQNRLVGITGSILADGSTTTLDTGYLNNQVGLGFGIMRTINYNAEILKPRSWILRNLRVVQNLGGNSMFPTGLIKLDPYNKDDGYSYNLIALDRMDVAAWQGDVSQNFRVYYADQAPTAVMPQTIANTDGTRKLIGAPTAGLTNAQTWATYGIAIAGAVAPCTTTRPDVVGGFACPTSTLRAPAPAGTAVITP